MRILRAADAEVVEEEIGNFALQFRVLDETEIIVRRNRAFITFLKDRPHAVMRDKIFDDLRDVLLRLERVVGVLDENDRLRG
ncbi:MAG: hypothetical protein BWY49_00113 [Candidatus Omnitrophica bacterium ADurb.Bin314]|nr:MAG: hypothetical protein BWY49_00113 [Candidatus Omnitrophica bacterium ADurb.Bin314]